MSILNFIFSERLLKYVEGEAELKITTFMSKLSAGAGGVYSMVTMDFNWTSFIIKLAVTAFVTALVGGFTTYWSTKLYKCTSHYWRARRKERLRTGKKIFLVRVFNRVRGKK